MNSLKISILCDVANKKLKYLTSTINTSLIEKNNQSEQSSGKCKSRNRQEKKKKKAQTCFPDLSLVRGH